MPARARLMVLAAAVCFGTTGTAQALGPQASPLAVGAVRLVLGALLLALAEAWIRERSHTPRLAFSSGRPGQLLAGAGVAGYALCFFAAVKLTGVAVGTVIALGSAPIFTGLGGLIVFGTRPTRAWVIATALAVAGVALIALSGSDADVDVAGVGLAALAGLSYATYTLSAKGLLESGVAAPVVMSRIFGLGALLVLPVLAFSDLGWAASVEGAAMALWLAVVTTAIAYLLFGHGLNELAAGEVATLTLAEPVAAVLLAALVLGERPGAGAVAGIGLVLAGLLILGLMQRSAQGRR